MKLKYIDYVDLTLYYYCYIYYYDLNSSILGSSIVK